MACSEYTRGRREQILVTLLQSERALPVEVLVKLLAYEARLELAVPLERLVQDGQVHVSFPYEPAERRAYYTLSNSGVAAAQACAASVHSTKSKKQHIARLLDRDTLFHFDVELAQFALEFPPELALFSTALFHARFEAVVDELRDLALQTRRGSIQGTAAHTLALAADERVHGKRRRELVYAHALLKELYLRGTINFTEDRLWCKTALTKKENLVRDAVCGVLGSPGPS